MEIRLTPEQEAAILQIARHEGKTPDQIVLEATINLYEGDQRLLKVLNERIQKADAGVFIEEKAMDARFKKMLGAE